MYSGQTKKLLFTTNKSRKEEHIEYVSIDFSNNGLQQILDDFISKGIQSVLVEGGSINTSTFY